MICFCGDDMVRVDRAETNAHLFRCPNSNLLGHHHFVAEDKGDMELFHHDYSIYVMNRTNRTQIIINNSYIRGTYDLKKALNKGCAATVMKSLIRNNVPPSHLPEFMRKKFPALTGGLL